MWNQLDKILAEARLTNVLDDTYKCLFPKPIEKECGFVTKGCGKCYPCISWNFSMCRKLIKIQRFETYYERCEKCDNCKTKTKILETVYKKNELLQNLIYFFCCDLQDICKTDNKVFLEECNSVINTIIEYYKICISLLSKNKHLTVEDVEKQFDNIKEQLYSTLQDFSNYFNTNRYKLISKKLQYMSDSELIHYVMACNLPKLGFYEDNIEHFDEKLYYDIDNNQNIKHYIYIDEDCKRIRDDAFVDTTTLKKLLGIKWLDMRYNKIEKPIYLYGYNEFLTHIRFTPIFLFDRKFSIIEDDNFLKKDYISEGQLNTILNLEYLAGRYIGSHKDLDGYILTHFYTVPNRINNMLKNIKCFTQLLNNETISVKYF